MVRWLHISDLHIEEMADWNNFKKEVDNKFGNGSCQDSWQL
ncbi:hypothetical protein [Acetobacterium paludosum]|nr:hypothetical protein [Acetobacterium paludosum]